MITVVFATRDRAESLPVVLDALAALRAPECGWKLVIADNGSRDATAAVLERYMERLPLTVVQEPEPGKNRALNRALPHIVGELAVLTDDDVIPEPDWLVRLHDAAAAQPDAIIFGGTVIPRWPGALPSFISEWAVNFSILFAKNEQPTGWCKPGVIFGPNMAVRTSVFRQGFKFAEDIGPNNSQRSYVMGSETDFVERVAAAGNRAWFVTEARVQHIIRPNQLTESWITKRYYLYGLHAQRNDSVQPPGVVTRRLVWAACAAVARFAPQSQLRLRALARDRFFAGVFASDPVTAAGRGLKVRLATRAYRGFTAYRSRHGSIP